MEYVSRRSANHPQINDEATANRSIHQTANTLPLPTSSPDSRRRMRNVLMRYSDLEEDTRDDTEHQELPPGTQLLAGSEDSRPRAYPGGRFQRSWEDRRNTSRNFVDSPSHSGLAMAGMHDAGDRLAQVNEDARGLLDRPLSIPGMQDLSAFEGEGRHRSKRRRTHTSMPKEYPRINYGHYGQVVPGKLEMQLVSTDGGIMSPYQRDHSPENMLKDDLRVYCTQSPRCNIVLRHKVRIEHCGCS